MLIVVGLYTVLWGKNKEMKQGREMDRPGLDNDDDDKGDEETAAAAAVALGLGFGGKAGAVAIASSRVDAIGLPVFSTISPNKRLGQLIYG